MFGGMHIDYSDDAVDSLLGYSFKTIDELWPNVNCGRGNGKSFYESRKWVEMLKPKIEKVIFNNPATIVFWSDNTKTVVKCGDEKFDPEKGLAMAISKKFLGTNKSNSNYYDIFKKWIPKEESTSKDKSTECTLTINAVQIEDGWKQLGSTGKSDGRAEIYFKGLI